jgi:protein O-GlcNAc transferase
LAAKKKHPSEAELGGLLWHYQNGRYGDAEKLGISITQRFPRHQLSWKLLGAALNQARKFQESLIPNKKAVDLDPKDA